MKKYLKAIAFLAAGLMLLSVLSCFETFALSAEDYYVGSEDTYGDTDRDSKVSVKDATAVQKHLAKIIELERKQELLADVDGNGKLSISDATEIQKYLANIINCFKVDPKLYVEANGEAVRVELTTEEPARLTLNVLKEGYYRLVVRKIEGGTELVQIFDGNKTIGSAYGDATIIEEYIYMKPGRYEIEVEPSWEYEKDVLDISVVSANEKIPFDFDNVQTLNDGDEIELKSGEAKSVAFYIDPKTSKVENDGLKIFTKGENPKVSFKLYEENLTDAWYNAGKTEDGVNTELKGLVEKPQYLLVTQEEGGSDFTLCCKNFSSVLEESADEIKVGDKLELITQYDEDYEAYNYIAESTCKFTPSESGYYKLSIQAEKEIMAGNGNMPYLMNFPEKIVFTRVDYLADEKSDVYYSVAFLEKGETYIFTKDFRSEEEAKVSLALEVSTEEEYSNWYEAVYVDYSVELESASTEINPGDRKFLSIGLENYEDYGYDITREIFKFTAEEDMTVVAFSEGSNSACVDVFDEEGEFVFSGYGNGNFSADFAVMLELEAGESCFMRVSSYDCYDSDDNFYFSMVDAGDYEEIN